MMKRYVTFCFLMVTVGSVSAQPLEIAGISLGKTNVQEAHQAVQKLVKKKEAVNRLARYSPPDASWESFEGRAGRIFGFTASSFFHVKDRNQNNDARSWESFDIVFAPNGTVAGLNRRISYQIQADAGEGIHPRAITLDQAIASITEKYGPPDFTDKLPGTYSGVVSLVWMLDAKGAKPSIAWEDYDARCQLPVSAKGFQVPESCTNTILSIEMAWDTVFVGANRAPSPPLVKTIHAFMNHGALLNETVHFTERQDEAVLKQSVSANKGTKPSL